MKRYWFTALVLIAVSAMAGPVFRIVCRDCAKGITNAAITVPADADEMDRLAQWRFSYGSGMAPGVFMGVFRCTNCHAFASANVLQREHEDYVREIRRLDKPDLPEKKKEEMFRVLAMSLEHARRTVSEGLAAKKLRPEAPCPACKHTMEWVHIDFAGTKEGRTGTSTNAIAVPCPNCGKTDLVVRVSHHFD